MGYAVQLQKHKRSTRCRLLPKRYDLNHFQGALKRYTHLRTIKKMKLTVKTLKGGKFEVEVEDSNTVEQVKGIIVRAFHCD